MSKAHPWPNGVTVSRRQLLTLLGCGGASLASGRAPHARAHQDPALRQGASWISTRLTHRYRLTYPFVGAGMGFVALPELVAAVSEAGGLGVLGVAPEPPPVFAERIAQIRALTAKPFGVDFFLVESPTLGPVTAEAHIHIAIAEQTSPVVFHFDTPPAPWVTALQAAGIDVWAQVPSLAAAQAALDSGVNGLIAQGVEAGGHSKSTTPLRHLLRDIRRGVGDDVLVLAAGGIATGAHVVQALARGADGVWVGSRLVASTEAFAHPDWKRRLVAAQRQDTVITTLFGPELPCQPYRVLRNRVVREFLQSDDDICGVPPIGAPIGTTTLFPGSALETPGVPMPKFSALLPTPDTIGDLEEMGLAAGTGVHHIRSIQPAAQIIAEMMGEARRLAMQRAKETKQHPEGHASKARRRQ